MKEFKISGKFKMGEKMQDFTKVVKGQNEKRVREKIYCDIGSRHRVKRSNITILNVEKVEE